MKFKLIKKNIFNKMIEYPDIVNLTREELLEEYSKLYDRFKELRESNEVDTQKIYELKRSLDTATAAQSYLAQELEQYTESDNKEIKNELQKTQAELSDMKKKYGELEVSFANLQQDNSLLMGENSKISRFVQKSVKCKEQHVSDLDIKVDDYILQIEILGNENLEFLQKMEDLEERSVRDTRTIAECEKNIEILRDQVKCLEENLQSKQIDLEEKMQILESTQEQLAEANAKVAAMSAAPNSNNRKGNSLFAEVDDQRQAMKQLLTAQKKNYLQMKKSYNESEHEIRRLKRENISMHTELEACSRIFCNADKIYQDKLNDRINDLLNQIEYLEIKLKWTQERVKELANDRGVLFLDSMLNFCRRETDDLKCQLHSTRIQKASLEEQLRKSQQDMARWRFESLKSRCILNDREHLLTEHKISFKPITALEYNISEKEKAEAKPRIVPARRGSILDSLYERKSLLASSKESITQEVNSAQQAINNISISNTSNIAIELEKEIKTEDSSISNTKIEQHKENVFINVVPIDTLIKNKEENPIIVENNDFNENLNISENNETIITVEDEEDIPISDNFGKLEAKPPTPMIPSQKSSKKSTRKRFAPAARSILTKQDDLIFKDSCKNVKFSSDGDTIHNLSTDASSSVTNTNSTNDKNTAQQSRIKSNNIIVRRVVVSSKRD